MADVMFVIFATGCVPHAELRIEQQLSDKHSFQKAKLSLSNCRDFPQEVSAKGFQGPTCVGEKQLEFKIEFGPGSMKRDCCQLLYNPCWRRRQGQLFGTSSYLAGPDPWHYLPCWNCPPIHEWKVWNCVVFDMLLLLDSYLLKRQHTRCEMILQLSFTVDETVAQIHSISLTRLQFK